jgi:hypothetical protein
MALDRANRWIRVRCTTINEWSGKRRDIDNKISLTTVRHPGGGRRWCFVCQAPRQGPPITSSSNPISAR